MHQTLQALLGLQEIDRDVFRVQRELERLPAEREARQAELERRKERIHELAQQAAGERVRAKEVEDQTRVHRQRIKKLENEASAARADMALQVAFQHEIRTLRRSISTAEEEALGMLEKVELLEKEQAGLKAQLETATAEFEELSANVEAELADARKRLAELLARRSERLSADVPNEALSMYGRLLQAREGEAMAELDGRICQVCYMEIPTNMVVRLMRGSELVQCPSCDRILFARN